MFLCACCYHPDHWERWKLYLQVCEHHTAYTALACDVAFHSFPHTTFKTLPSYHFNFSTTWYDGYLVVDKVWRSFEQIATRKKIFNFLGVFFGVWKKSPFLKFLFSKIENRISNWFPHQIFARATRGYQNQFFYKYFFQNLNPTGYLPHCDYFFWETTF